jgi:hypothetical protein
MLWFVFLLSNIEKGRVKCSGDAIKNEELKIKYNWRRTGLCPVTSNLSNTSSTMSQKQKGDSKNRLNS